MAHSITGWRSRSRFVGIARMEDLHGEEGCPCSSSGKSSTGGTLQKMACGLTSSGARSLKSRNWRNTETASSSRKIGTAITMSGPSGCKRKLERVTTPKLLPAPRTPQNKSALTSSLAVRTCPSAVTISTARRLSRASPKVRWSVPMPPCKRETRHAGAAHLSTGRGEPEALRFAIDIGPGGATLDARGGGVRIDDDRTHPGEIDHQPAIVDGVAGHVVAAAPNRQQEALIPGKVDRRRRHRRRPGSEQSGLGGGRSIHCGQFAPRRNRDHRGEGAVPERPDWNATKAEASSGGAGEGVGAATVSMTRSSLREKRHATRDLTHVPCPCPEWGSFYGSRQAASISG